MTPRRDWSEPAKCAVGLFMAVLFTVLLFGLAELSNWLFYGS